MKMRDVDCIKDVDLCLYVDSKYQSAQSNDDVNSKTISFSQAVPSHVAIDVAQTSPVYFLFCNFVATGQSHYSRSLGQVVLVDHSSTLLFSSYVRPNCPIRSYLTPLTGLSSKEIQKYGVNIADVSESLRQLIPSNSVLVGKNIREQLKCLKLIEGYDYECVFDINSLFYIWNDEKQYYEFFSQDHIANAWLNRCPRDVFDPIQDCVDTSSIFNYYHMVQNDINELEHLRSKALKCVRGTNPYESCSTVDDCCTGHGNHNCRCKAASVTSLSFPTCYVNL